MNTFKKASVKSRTGTFIGRLLDFMDALCQFAEEAMSTFDLFSGPDMTIVKLQEAVANCSPSAIIAPMRLAVTDIWGAPDRGGAQERRESLTAFSLFDLFARILQSRDSETGSSFTSSILFRRVAEVVDAKGPRFKSILQLCETYRTLHAIGCTVAHIRIVFSRSRTLTT